MVVRIDKRFWVPDHSKKAGDYSRGHAALDDTGKAKENGNENENREGQGGNAERGVRNMINNEEEVLDDTSPEEEAAKNATPEKRDR